MSRARKKTANPASDKQKAIVGRLIGLLVQYGIYQNTEDAQIEFAEQVGYGSIKEISTLNARTLTALYSRILDGSDQRSKRMETPPETLLRRSFSYARSDG